MFKAAAVEKIPQIWCMVVIIIATSDGLSHLRKREFVMRKFVLSKPNDLRNKHSLTQLPCEDLDKCSKSCQPLYPSSIQDVHCFLNEEIINCAKAVSGTTAMFSCKSLFYEYPVLAKPISICLNGTWSDDPPECSPECGTTKKRTAGPSVAGGNVTNPGDFSWQIAIYTKSDKNLICGGTLLSVRIVLTAAHCVTDVEAGELLPKENYLIVGGKYYRAYDHEEDEPVQESEIYEMFVPDVFKGERSNYMGDIAIIILKDEFTLTKFVAPICTDWYRRYEAKLSNPKTFGLLAGWGKTGPDDSPSDRLLSLRVPFVPRKTCEEFIPESIEDHLTSDKICAGYIHKSKSVCQGDSGGGLIFKNRGRHFIAGIVSISPRSKSGGCDIEEYALYTSVFHYIDNFIFEKVARASNMKETTIKNSTMEDNSAGLSHTIFRRSTWNNVSCILPQYQQFGYFSAQTIGKNETPKVLSPGERVQTGTKVVLQSEVVNDLDIPSQLELDFFCDKTYRDLGLVLAVCENGTWLNSLDNCSDDCILPEHPKNGKLLILGERTKVLEPKATVPSGTLVGLHCNKNHRLKGRSVALCASGRWSAQLGNCLRTCPSLFNTPKMKVVCSYNSNIMQDCSNPPEGTVVKFKCPSFYEPLVTFYEEKKHMCLNGKWTFRQVPKCVPGCGRTHPRLSVINGTIVPTGNYPWQAAIYKRSANNVINFECGGSLISTRLILTAAHCVTDDKAKLLPKESYVIAVGKYLREFNSSLDYATAQYSTVKTISIPSTHKKRNKKFIESDIAILVLKKPFVLTKWVQPVCIDWQGRFDNYIEMSDCDKIFVSGWGRSDLGGKNLDILKDNRVMVSNLYIFTRAPDFDPFEDLYGPADVNDKWSAAGKAFFACKPIYEERQDSKDFLRNAATLYETRHKIDHTHLFRTNKNASPIIFEGGTGMVRFYESRHYLIGVSSMVPNSAEFRREEHFRGVYTKVQKYRLNFILEAEAMYRK